jgi:hypothetical protein
MKPFKLSNGVIIPAGEIVVSPIRVVHMDKALYPNPHKFDGFRFSKMREQEGQSAKHFAAQTGTEFLTFGHGEHAWFVNDLCSLILALADSSPSMKWSASLLFSYSDMILRQRMEKDPQIKRSEDITFPTHLQRFFFEGGIEMNAQDDEDAAGPK